MGHSRNVGIADGGVRRHRISRMQHEGGLRRTGRVASPHAFALFQTHDGRYARSPSRGIAQLGRWDTAVSELCTQSSHVDQSAVCE